jgi:hypothetical protein
MSYLRDPEPSETGASPGTKERILQPGIEKGFFLSPMGILVSEYNTQTDSDLSLFIRSTSIVSKKSLDLSDVMDRGVPFVKQPVGRFGLNTELLLGTEKTIKDMQELLTKASKAEARRSLWIRTVFS